MDEHADATPPLDDLIDTLDRFQGTDGVRGRISSDVTRIGDAVLSAGADGVLTPVFFHIYARAFCELALDAGIASPGDAVLIGGDGRDYHRGGVFRAAFFSGVVAAGLTVTDAAVAPTPAIPIYAVSQGIRLAVALTASHNPSNQNGIKCFVDGFKLLPDTGVIHDAGLTARIMKIAREQGHVTPDVSMSAGVISCHDDVLRVFIETTCSALPARDFSGLDIVFDPANGACVESVLALADMLGIKATLVNADPTGDNINQNGGVAELEGIDFIEGCRKEGDGSGEGAGARRLPVVAEVFRRGRVNGNEALTVALVNDGDGDRGFMLVYLPESDRVRVLDGDALAVLWLTFARNAERIADGDIFAVTVESDLMAPIFAKRTVHVEPYITCVGDKWLTAFYNPNLPARDGSPGRRLALAAEQSGHIIIPLNVTTPGGTAVVYTGNGVLSVLSVMAFAVMQNAAPDTFIEPFPPGVTATAYVYFADRSRFFRDSDLWRNDVRIVQDAFQAAIARGDAPAGMSIRPVDFDQEPDMLYFSLNDPAGDPVGAMFVRNSGTETKQSVYIRGERRFERILTALLIAVRNHHRCNARDEKLREYRIAKEIRAVLQGGRAAPEMTVMRAADLLSRVSKRLTMTISETDFAAILYGLRKEASLQAVSGGYRLNPDG